MVARLQNILLTTYVCLDTSQVEVMTKGMDVDQVFTFLTFIYEYQFQFCEIVIKSSIPLTKFLKRSHVTEFLKSKSCDCEILSFSNQALLVCFQMCVPA